MLDAAVLPWTGSPRTTLPPNSADERLVAEADAEHRRARFGECPDRGAGDSGLGRRAGPGRDDHAVRAAREQLVDAGRVVAHNVDLRAELAQVLDEVVGERVVVVDDQDLHAQSP